MKFKRHARPLQSRLDAAPVASVFFLLVIFMMLGSLAYTPGVLVQLPVANDLPGVEKPTVTVAVDANNRLYFANRLVTEAELILHLKNALKNSPEPLTLVLHVDKAVTHENLVRLWLLARDVGIRQVQQATLPGLIAAPAKP